MDIDASANPGKSDRDGRRPWSDPAVADEDVSRTAAAKFNSATEGGSTTPFGPS